MAIAAGKKLKVDHFDVKNAFTQSKIDAEIYVEAPPGNFVDKDSNGRPKILKLKKALYGTKQASKLYREKRRTARRTHKNAYGNPFPETR